MPCTDAMRSEKERSVSMLWTMLPGGALVHSAAVLTVNRFEATTRWGKEPSWEAWGQRSTALWVCSTR
jgi:hypothetical protein